MISLIIPTTSSGREYTEFAVSKIRELYPDENSVEIVVEENDNVSLGINYNNAVKKSKGEIIVLMHNDMVPHPGFVEYILEHVKRGRILTYHRIEPEIFNDLYPGKTIYDCGSDIKTYVESRFFSHIEPNELIDGGSQLFFAIYKDDYIGIDGYTFKKFCEDDDIHLRYKLLGFEFKVAKAAMVYHFVSKTSRQGNYREIEEQSIKNFINKWGFLRSTHNKVYKKHIIVKNDHYNELDSLRVFGLRPIEDSNIIITIDRNSIKNNEQLCSVESTLMVMNDIIYETDSTGKFEIEGMYVEVKSLESFEKELLYLDFET